MAIFKVENLMFNYADKELFNNLSFQLNQGEHAVLVGQNGCGKTTIFDLLTKKLTPDKGTITWTPHVTYSYLDQHYKVNDEFTVEEFLYQIYKELFDKEKRMNELFEKGSNTDDPDYEKYLNLAMLISDDLLRAGFYSIKEDVDKVLVGLGIPKEYKDRKLTLLSSGQREKVYLAKMLLEKANIEYEWVDAEENAELTVKLGVKKAPTLLVPNNGGFDVYENASNIKGWIESRN